MDQENLSAGEKQLLRARIREERAERSAHPAALKLATAGLTEQLCAYVTGARASRVACFVGVRGEPDTRPFLAWAREHGVEVLLPRSRAGGVLEWCLMGDEELGPGLFGIPEPTGPALPRTAVLQADVLFIPAAAVDHGGARLGWGLGYYDRVLAALRGAGCNVPPVLAVVFESEVLAALPTEPHDVPVQGAVTEVRRHNFG